MTQIHLVSHTHWDREWYQPFQLFRLRLVNLIDNLLSILENDPQYQHFTLDGQTIVLDDYLEYRPEKAASLKRFVKEGRLLIGPWYILPDEFLVSPEATVRNLLQGERASREFGAKMPVGYIPDPFGHIGQMPQILKGFGMDSAAFQRGLAADTTEFWWQAPDGSQVFTVYLRDGYGNASYLPVNDNQRTVQQIKVLRDSLLPYTHSPNVLLMFGTDHMVPRPQTSSAVAWANQHLNGDRVIHSTLPAYIAAVRSSLNGTEKDIPVLTGEMRSSRRSPILPGVLSARMWIKQRNHACENLLERWAEPFSMFAQLYAGSRDNPEFSIPSHVRLDQPAEILRRTWRLLMECHPHDSICGCSIDQVHDEMRARFDQVDQVGEEITRQSLQCLADVVDTHTSADAVQSLVVFNPTQYPQTGMVAATFQLPADIEQFNIVDDQAQPVQFTIREQNRMELARMDFDKEGLAMAAGYIQTGEFNGSVLEDINIQRRGDTCLIRLVMKDRGEPDMDVLNQGLETVKVLLQEPELRQFSVQFITPNQIKVDMLCRDVPGLGYKSYAIRAGEATAAPAQENLAVDTIENEYFTISLDRDAGTLTLTDRRTGRVLSGLNRFVDGGDRGDEYNYTPLPGDRFISPRVDSVTVERNPVFSRLKIDLTLDAPVALLPDRSARSEETQANRIETWITLTQGIPRVDVSSTVDNLSQDHRLRVHFPAPIHVDHATYDAHFDVIQRSLGIPGYDASWSEAPRPEQPQRRFVSISDKESGLMIVNRGLPEVEVIPTEEGTEIALTLLRSVGWLSRGDLDNRPGHAGPGYPTPGAQLIGRWKFDYAILPLQGEWQTTLPLAAAFDLPFRAASTSVHPGALPPAASLIELAAQPLVFSSFKPSENGQGFILRAYNPTDQAAQWVVKPWFRCLSTCRVRLDETMLEELPIGTDGIISIPCRPHEIVSIMLKPGI
ncbi:MAG TPA: glycoside hydrolase family 38 C-terminal domain-containing protein [Anaerolineaceae bacterium]|nr:glycoside hydrolase family 38 C-terminal domain-containing protein [Anaerolineaceae bacterium]